MLEDDTSFPDLARGSAPSTKLFALGFHTEGSVPECGFAAAEQAGDFIGRYELIVPLGEGGFGVVWRARQHEPLQREVALKAIKQGLDSREIIARFEAERQALALMDHPNIAAVHDAGTTASGMPYFVMELVQGKPLTVYCDEHRLGLRERLALLISVCKAVQHAHQKAVLHRDLKPSNILVAEIDGKAVPKVIDFGIAKALSPTAEHLGQTQVGMVMGTPQYMSPEQAGSTPDVDTRSDVYSLGVILCELLTGATPLSLDQPDFVTALRLIRESNPPRPSSMVQTITPAVSGAAEKRRIDPTKFARALRGDLDWITLKALEKDRTRRYESVTALSDDLERYLEQKTVSAAAPSVRYQLGKFARRHRVLLVAAALVLVSMIAGTGVSLWQASRAERSRAEAEANYASARDAVETYLSAATEYIVLAKPEFLELKKGLLKTALPFYEKISRAQSDDPKMRSNQAWALSRLGNIYQQVQDYKVAEDYYRQAMAIEERLAIQYPHQPQYPHALSLRYNNLGKVLASQGKKNEAIVECDRAVKLLESLTAEFKNEPDYPENLATVLCNRGEALLEMNKEAEAEASYLRAAVVQKELATRFPQQPKYREQWGSTEAHLGNLYKSSSQFEQAVAPYRTAMGLYRKLADDDTTNQDHRHGLAQAQHSLGLTLLKLDQHGEGMDLLRKALALCQGLIAETPGNASYREEFLVCQKTIGNALMQKGPSAETDAALLTVLKEQQKLYADFPLTFKYREDLAALLEFLARRARNSKDLGKAKDFYEQALKIHPRNESHLALAEMALDESDHAAINRHISDWAWLAPEDKGAWEHTADLMVKALNLARKDPKLDDTTRAGLVESYSKQTVFLLKEAIARGYEGLWQFSSPELTASLRERPDFQALTAKGSALSDLHTPRKFRFDYKASDPGARYWMRDDSTWTEIEPSGSKNTYTVHSRTEADGIPGTELHRSKGTGPVLFVPDIGTRVPLWLRMKRADGTWTLLGKMLEVE